MKYKIFYQTGLMLDMLGEKSWFPPGMTSYVNIQRQFFDAFVGQTFKVRINSFFVKLSQIFQTQP